MRDLNTILLKLAKRAETNNKRYIIESFVDVGPLFTLLSNRDNQILLGRRGTGKTHVLGYLANQIQDSGRVVVQLDMRTIGSTGGIYADQALSIPERATRLLADTLGAIQHELLTSVIDRQDCDC
jgi:Cdc6-like AAA superfamily ATPase